MELMKKKIIYLDRDGVINKDPGYIYKTEDFRFIDGVFEACHWFLKSGFEIIVITNQSGIGRGYYSLQDYEALTSHMLDQFNQKGINILKVYFCPHAPDDNCSCRKPETGMIEQSLADFEIDLEKSWLIGDKISDMECAQNANIPNRILIGNNPLTGSFFTTKTLQDCPQIIRSINNAL